VTYNPARLQGVSVFREEQRQFAIGDHLQLTAPFNEKRIANRELATLEKIDDAGNLKLRLDSGQRLRFNLSEHPSLDYGYAVTSHSSEGATAQRALILVDTGHSTALVNERMAYVAISRAAVEVKLYTDSAAELATKLSRENSKTLAYELSEQKSTGMSMGMRL
jgi:hypothetical protein